MTSKWKDGDKCEFGSGSGTLVVSNEDRNGVVIVMDQHGEYRRVAESQLKPLKTPEEVERERVVELAFKTLTIDNSDLAYKICQDLYDAGLLTDKKVKYLTRKEFEKIFEDNISAMGFSVNILKVYDEIFGANQ